MAARRRCFVQLSIIRGNVTTRLDCVTLYPIFTSFGGVDAGPPTPPSTFAIVRPICPLAPTRANVSRSRSAVCTYNIARCRRRRRSDTRNAMNWLSNYRIPSWPSAIGIVDRGSNLVEKRKLVQHPIAWPFARGCPPTPAASRRLQLGHQIIRDKVHKVRVRCLVLTYES